MTAATIALDIAAAAIFAIGLFTVVARGNLIKKLIGLLAMHAAAWTVMLGLSVGPIAAGEPVVVNPLPAALALAAMVIGLTTLVIGLDLALRIRASAVSTEDDEITAHELKP